MVAVRVGSKAGMRFGISVGRRIRRRIEWKIERRVPSNPPSNPLSKFNSNSPFFFLEVIQSFILDFACCFAQSFYAQFLV